MPSPVSELFDRRVPQWTAVYIGAGWGLVQFIAFMEERYMISPHWTDLFLLSLGLLLPSVVLYTYNHGRPGADRMQRTEKLGIPANVAIAAVVLWLVFGNEDLGAMTTAVTVTDENGETIERELAKPEHRRRIALFAPEAATGVDSAWKPAAVNLGLQYDLAQDSWLDVRPAQLFAERLREAGYEADEPVPLALKRQIAHELNLTHFTNTTVAQDASGYRLTLELYDAARGRRLAQRTFAGGDLLVLVDSASLQMRRDLNLPLAHIDEVEDLPVAERLTSNGEALRAFARGRTAAIANDWVAAVALLGRAVELDPTFAAAAGGLFEARLYTSDHEGAMQALGIAADHMYRLPERLQFFIRAGQYQMRQELDRAIGVLEMGAQLYPGDLEPHLMLAMLLPQVRRERDAIRHLHEVLRIDPGQVDHLLTVGQLHRQLGEYDSAIAVYEQFGQAAPKRTEGHRSIAAIEALRGNHDAAREALERALLLDANNVDALITLASLERDVGEFEQARRHLDEAATAARTAESRYRVAEARSYLSHRLGQPTAAFDHLQTSVAHAAEFTPPIIVQIYRLGALRPLVEAGRLEDARTRLAEVAPSLTGPFADLVSIGELMIETSLPQPDPARIEATAERVDGFITRMGWAMLQPKLLNARGRAAELRGDPAAAVALYRQQLELDPSGLTVHVDLARALRASGDLPGAMRQIDRVLGPRPADPEARLELARIHEEAGRTEDALAELRRALQIWRDAEPAYRPAAEARGMLDRLLSVRPAGDRL